MSQRTLFFGAAVLVIGLFGLIFITQGPAWFATQGAGTATSTATSTLGGGATSTPGTNTGTPPNVDETIVAGLVRSISASARSITLELAQSGKTFTLAASTSTSVRDEQGSSAGFSYIRPGFTVRAVGKGTATSMVPRVIDVISAPNILLYAPKVDATIGTPVTLSGEARVFENQFSYRIIDQNGKVLGQGSVYAQSPDVGQFGPFEVRASYEAPSTTTGFVEVYDNSARDGAEIGNVKVPVKFSAGATAQVNVFFSSRAKDPNGEFCGTVYAVSRTVPKSTTPARDALEALLAGPTDTESRSGYFTSINSGVTLKSVTIQNGTARADFDAEIEREVGGSCRVTAIRAQITRTLMQFASVKNVVISVNGRTDDVLQP
jgi:hypothetical protein